MSGKGLFMVALVGGGIYLLSKQTIGDYKVATQAAGNIEFSGISFSVSGGKIIGVVKLKMINTGNETLKVTNLKIWVQAFGQTVASVTPSSDVLGKIVISPKTQSQISLPITIDLLNVGLTALRLKDLTEFLINAIVDIPGLPEIKLENYKYKFNGADFVNMVATTVKETAQTVKQTANSADQSVSQFRQTIVASAVKKYRQDYPTQDITVYSSSFLGIDAFASYYIQGIEGGIKFTWKIGIAGGLSPVGASEVEGLEEEDL